MKAILGLLLKRLKGNKFVLVMTDSASKLMRAVPTSKANVSHIASLLMDNWIILCRIPTLTENWTQFVSQLFQLLSAFLGRKPLTSKAYHPQTNGQSERFEKSVLARLGHNVAEHQRDSSIYGLQLRYANSAQAHCSTNLTPFILVLSPHPRYDDFKSSHSVTD